MTRTRSRTEIDALSSVPTKTLERDLHIALRRAALAEEALRLISRRPEDAAHVAAALAAYTETFNKI